VFGGNPCAEVIGSTNIARLLGGFLKGIVLSQLALALPQPEDSRFDGTPITQHQQGVFGAQIWLLR